MIRITCFSLLLFSMPLLIAAAEDSPTTASQPGQQQFVLDKTPGDFLPLEPLKGSSQPGFYNEIPPNLEAAVRAAAEDNYTSSTPMLLAELGKATEPKEKARIQMWLGITMAQQAKDYDAAAGWYGVATTSCLYLREAIKLDPEVFKGADAARALADMVGSGWAAETPESEIEKARKKAETDNSAIHYYYAGVILKRVSSRSWLYSNTQLDDEKALGFLAKAVVREPTRYELWGPYFDMVERLKLTELQTTDGQKMFAYFKSMRAPIMGDQGPQALFLRTQTGITLEMALQFLDAMQTEYPDDPFPQYHRAQILMHSNPPRALEEYEKVLANIKSGAIKLQPREQGYRISTLYKIAFLHLALGRLEKAMEVYAQVQDINPTYAETNFNIGEIYRQMAERETTGTKKLELLEKGMAALKLQSKSDYMGRAVSQTEELRKQMSSLSRKVKSAIGDSGDYFIFGPKTTSAPLVIQMPPADTAIIDAPRLETTIKLTTGTAAADTTGSQSWWKETAARTAVPPGTTLPELVTTQPKSQQPTGDAWKAVGTLDLSGKPK